MTEHNDMRRTGLVGGPAWQAPLPAHDEVELVSGDDATTPSASSRSSVQHACVYARLAYSAIRSWPVTATSVCAPEVLLDHDHLRAETRRGYSRR